MKLSVRFRAGMIWLLAMTLVAAGFGGFSPAQASGADGPDGDATTPEDAGVMARPEGDQSAGDIEGPGAGGPGRAPETDPPERPESIIGSAAVPPATMERYGRGFRVDPREFTFTQHYFWHRLFHPTSQDRLIGTAVFMGATGLAAEKRNLQAEVAESDTPQRKLFFRNVQTLGGQGVVPVIGLLFYLGGASFGSYRVKETGYLIAQSALLTAIMTGAGQWVINEDRPREGGRIHPFQGVGHGVSGHSSTAASLAAVISRVALRIDADDGRGVRMWKRFGKGLAYGLPVMVGFARVNEQQHFAYNSLLGIGIGFWVGNVVVDAHETYLDGQRPRGRRPNQVGPIVGVDGSPGLGARWEF